MKVSELITTVYENMPNDIAEQSIINWINYMEDEIYSNIIGTLNTEPHISEDGLSESSLKYKPDVKTLILKDTQELSLGAFGNRWHLMYEYYIYAQISLLKEEFGKGNNYISLYNNMVDEFVQMYFSRYKSNREWR